MQISIRLLILCLFLWFLPITLHVSSQDVPEVSSQEQHQIIQEYTCIKTALYREARGEPTEGIKAVLSVIHNRKNHKDYPSTYCAVIKQPYQFSYYNSIKHDRTPYKASEAQLRATIASLAFEASVGSFKPILGSNYLYYNTKQVDQKKKNNNSTKSTENKVTINNHVFYTTKG